MIPSLYPNPAGAHRESYRVTMTRRIISCFAGVAIAVVLAGCATAAAPVPESSPIPTSTPSALPSPSFDPAAVPENRFGLDCATILSDADISGLYGQPLALNPSTHWGARWTEALIADGAVNCRWGDGPYLDVEATSIEIVANSREGVKVDDLASLVLGSPSFTPTSVAGVGDEAWVWCRGDSGAPSCSWSIAVDDLWISLAFLRAPDTEVDQIAGDYGSVIQTPRDGSTSQFLAARVARQIAAAPRESFPSPRGLLGPCDSVVDWTAVAESLGLPLQSVDSAEESTWNYPPLAVEIALGVAARARQSIQSCAAKFGDDSNGGRPTYVFLTAVPGGEWLERSGLWPAWRVEDCHGFEGGPVCDLSAQTEAAAVTVRVGGGHYEGVAATVLAAFEG